MAEMRLKGLKSRKSGIWGQRPSRSKTVSFWCTRGFFSLNDAVLDKLK